MEIIIKAKKKKVLKKLLKKTDIELKKTIEKVLDDWTNHTIQTKYQSQKGIDEIVDELDKNL